MQAFNIEPIAAAAPVCRVRDTEAATGCQRRASRHRSSPRFTPMSHRFSCCLLLVFASTAAADSTRSSNWAERMFSQTEHDFGVVTKGADVRHKIEIKNQFGEPITLHSATSTCGCTTPELSTRTLQPGETGYLELKLNTVRFSKQKHPNVDVKMSYGKSPITTVRIPVHAYIRDDVTTSQDTVDFGVVGAGEASKKSVTVSYHGHAPWKITGVQDAGKGMTVEISKPTRTSQGLSYTLNVTLSPDLPLGSIDRSLVVLTEEPAKSYVNLRVRATVEADITLANPVVHLGVLKPNAVTSTRLVIRGRKPFAVEAVEGLPGTVTAEVGNHVAKTVHVVPVQITAPAVPGKFSQELQVKCGANRPPVTCRVEGEVLNQTVTPGLVDATR
jgi:hypothetical protein